LITTAHGPSAANNNYWPEMYTNQPIVDAKKKHPYSDMASPKLFGNVGGFDPQLFLSANECTDDLVKGQHRGKYSPLDVAGWLDRFSSSATWRLSETSGARKSETAEARRLEIDVAIQAGIGRFFASKMRCAVLYAVYEKNTRSGGAGGSA